MLYTIANFSPVRPEKFATERTGSLLYLSIEDRSYLTKHEVAHSISALSDLLVSDNNDVSTVTTGSNRPQQWLGAVGKSAS